MSEPTLSDDFDTAPPMPLDEYDQTVRRVNIGYELIFTLTLALLRGLHRDDLNLLVVGAGGGMEIETFAPTSPGWRLTGVDPSANMLALARQKAEARGVSARVELVQGTVAALPAGSRYDAATCIFVLHFIPDDGSKLAVLQDIAQRLRPGAPLILVSPVRESPAHSDAFVPAWQAYGELMGMPPAEMAATIDRIRARHTGSAEDRHVALLREAGFTTVTRFFTAFAIVGWVAR